MKKLALFIIVSLFTYQIGLAEIQRDEPLINFSIKLVPISFYKLDLPAEVETVPQMYDYTKVSDSQFARADLEDLLISSVAPSIELNLLERLRLSYSLYGCYGWERYKEKRYHEGVGSESYVYVKFEENWFLMHELALDMTVYKTEWEEEWEDFRVGFAYTTTELEFERGWYRYSSWDEYASVRGDVEIYSLKFQVRSKDEGTTVELYFDYGTIDFQKIEKDGKMVGVRFAVVGCFF